MVRVLSLIILIFSISGCAVGVGQDTLVKANASSKALEDLDGIFSHFLVESDQEVSLKLINLTPSASPNRMKYSNYLERRYGDPDFEAAQLGLTIRDRSKVPPFLPIDLSSLLTGEVAKLALDGDVSIAEKIDRQNFLEARLLNVPDLKRSTTAHRQVNKAYVYHYYPRIAVEFSSSLLSASQLDRFSYLGLAIKLKDPPKSKAHDERVRFIDFSPKEADIVEYTRGKLTKQNEVSAKASAGLSPNSSKQIVKPISGVEDSTETRSQSRGFELGSDLTFTASETYVNELKDSIEARNAGVKNKGSLFFAEFRSIKNRRIGGTYTFDLMLEVPSILSEEDEGGVIINDPVVETVIADIYLIGVVRHVYNRGFTGILNRVPEPENDDSYHQVVFEELKDEMLWRPLNEPWVGKVADAKPSFTVKVFTNRSDARFVLRNADDGSVLGAGSGEKAEIKVALGSDTDDITAFVEFLDVSVISEKQGLVTFTSDNGSNFQIKKEDDGSHSEVGNYRPR